MKDERVAQPPEVKWTVAVHPELKDTLKHQAIDEGLKDKELVHKILCHALDRMDLFHRMPDAVTTA